MNNEWMIDVLKDLRSFAQKQFMTDLAEHLDDAILVAATEIRTDSQPKQIVKSNDAQAGTLPRMLGEHRLI